MSKGKIVGVLLLAMLFVNLCLLTFGCTSQGPQEQLRPAENQSPAEEDVEEPMLENPEERMEETAAEEQRSR